MSQLDRGTHLTREGAIAVLTMSNPGKRNAFSPEMRDDLIRHLETLQRDPSCRAIVLQGADGCFSAGGDVSGFGSKTAVDYRAGLLASHRFVRLLITGETPVVAAVEGYAYGRSEEHTSELKSLMRISYADFCLQKKKPT